MSMAYKLLLLASGISLLWASAMFMAERIFTKWRSTPHYLPLWIMLCLPAHIAWVSVLLEVR